MINQRTSTNIPKVTSTALNKWYRGLVEKNYTSLIEESILMEGEKNYNKHPNLGVRINPLLLTKLTIEYQLEEGNKLFNTIIPERIKMLHKIEDSKGTAIRKRELMKIIQRYQGFIGEVMLLKENRLIPRRIHKIFGKTLGANDISQIHLAFNEVVYEEISRNNGKKSTPGILDASQEEFILSSALPLMYKTIFDGNPNSVKSRLSRILIQ